MTAPVPHERTSSELLVFERSEVGRVRDHNEDSKYSDPDGRFFVVADGMGGHAAGEVASQLAVEEVKSQLAGACEVLDEISSVPNSRTRPIMTELLTRVGTLANEAVRRHAEENTATRGMGTTLEVVCITADGAWIGHVGDSRTYLVRSGSVTQLTTDHTVAQRMANDNQAPTAAMLEQWGSVLVEAIGAKDSVNVEVVHSRLKRGDCLLLCSDGLYEYFPRAKEIAEVLAMEGSKAGLERLVDLAYDRGGKDNITGVLVEIVELPTSNGDSEELAYAATLTGFAPIGDIPDQDYGIEDAIALMRKLPEENLELVVRVVKQTLRSTNVSLIPILSDATSKQARLEREVEALKNEISSLEGEVASRLSEITTLDDDRAETTMVMERLKLAQSQK